MSFVPYKAMNILVVATDSCNLRCKYCLNGQGSYEKNLMSDDTLKRIFELTFPKYESLQFIWHGGEPLCAGLEFYKKAIALQKEYASIFHTEVLNSIQTNGVLIDTDTAAFLAENRFSVGVSFDGPVNDITRGKTEQTLKGIRELQKTGLQHLGVISVVSNYNITRLIESYNYMKQLHIPTDYNSLIATGGVHNNPDSILNEDCFVEEEKKFFEYWLGDLDCNIVINPFYSYIRDILFGSASVCWHTSCLGRWICVHANGDIYPCSREYPEDYSFGNIKDINQIDDVWESQGFGNLLEATIKRRDICKDNCEFYDYCQGGCSCNAYTENEIDKPNGFTCRTFKKVFGYVYSRVEQLLQNGDYSLINPTVTSLIQASKQNSLQR